MIDIGVVLVTFNRLDLLKQTLQSFDNQTKSPRYIIVVNNASNDGTEEYLKKWGEVEEEYKKIIINNPVNTGGAGGFGEGLERAIKESADWIWVSDDDAFPKQDAIEKAQDYLEKNAPRLSNISAICGKVINNGVIDIKHRRRMFERGLKIIGENVPETEYSKKDFEINCFSYVGSIISREKLKNVGVTRKDYFIWWDDTEHSLRLSNAGKIVCVPSICINHNVDAIDGGVTWKNYYGIRNSFDIYRRYFSRKSYYYCKIRLLKTMLFGKKRIANKELRKMIVCALRDSKNERFGLHSVYKPGWNTKKSN